MFTTLHVFRSPVARHLHTVLAGTLLLLANGLFATAGFAAEDTRLLQRQYYTLAHEALAHGDTDAYQTLLPLLTDYPLLPYLEYAELNRQFNTLTAADVDRFIERHAGTVLATRLERQWLQTLVRAERWPEALRYYRPALASTELTCQVLDARIKAGDTAAFDVVAPLWNVGRSQPNVCDPVFAAWLAAGHLTPQLGWDRFSKTLQARQLSLARYISGLLPPREKTLAETWLQVDQQPELLREQQRFSGEHPELPGIILHGLQRLAQVDASLAQTLWNRYDTSHDFDDSEKLAIRRFIVQRLLTQGQVSTAETLLLEDPALPSAALVEWLLRDALKQQNWERFDAWLVLLPESARNTERWRYWQARSLARHGTPEKLTAANALFADLALTRNFYGFLAADLLGRSYELVDRPVAVADATLQQVSKLPAMVRALELYAIGDESNALPEWQHALTGLDEQQILAAGKLAEAHGWHRNGIQALIQVSYWDDLQLRFPLAYQDLIVNAAERNTALSPHFVFAVARQESAFMHDVRSSAGALGLMQLMPATARETASTAGVSISSNQDILKPEVNIALGSQYLARMMQDFGGNRILAAAAYNAGPARVRQWLRQDSNQPLPFDIWIETIPFNETRGYVQNVLAYSVIYGYRMGESLPLLTEDEVASLL
jgi:soluble lytic murein transglycosylase